MTREELEALIEEAVRKDRARSRDGCELYLRARRVAADFETIGFADGAPAGNFSTAGHGG